MVRKASLLSLAVILVFIGIVGIGEHYLWHAMINYHFKQLSRQVQTILYNEISQGNLFEISADLDKLRMSGLVENVALTQMSATANWLYVSNSKIVRLVDGRKAAIRRCSTGRVEMNFTNNDTALVTFLIGSKGLGENACIVVQSKIPGELTGLRDKVNFVIILIVSLSIVLFVLAIIRMTHDQFRYEKIANEKLKETAEKLNAFAQQVSHDIRSPLSALNTVIGTLDLTTISQDKQNLVKNATKRINDIASDLLNQGRRMLNENTKSVVDDAAISEPGAVDLLPCIYEIVSEKKAQLRPNITLKSEIAPNCHDVKVALDRSVLLRVFSNLINNSIEAIPAAGSITIYARKQNGLVSISISDTGVGIPQKIIDAVGTVGVSHGKTGGASGFGLGLSFAKQAIGAASGRITIQSRVGTGTIVNIVLPIADQQT